MAISDLHRHVAGVALAAAAGHEFRAGRRYALLAYGIIGRPTQDVDLFTHQEHGVEAAADVVRRSLRSAGYLIQMRPERPRSSPLRPFTGLVSSPHSRQMTNETL
jgi:hypothetical protein